MGRPRPGPAARPVGARHRGRGEPPHPEPRHPEPGHDPDRRHLLAHRHPRGCPQHLCPGVLRRRPGARRGVRGRRPAHLRRDRAPPGPRGRLRGQRRAQDRGAPGASRHPRGRPLQPGRSAAGDGRAPAPLRGGGVLRRRAHPPHRADARGRSPGGLPRGRRQEDVHRPDRHRRQRGDPGQEDQGRPAHPGAASSGSSRSPRSRGRSSRRTPSGSSTSTPTTGTSRRAWNRRRSFRTSSATS